MIWLLVTDDCCDLKGLAYTYIHVYFFFSISWSKLIQVGKFCSKMFDIGEVCYAPFLQVIAWPAATICPHHVRKPGRKWVRKQSAHISPLHQGRTRRHREQNHRKEVGRQEEGRAPGAKYRGKMVWWEKKIFEKLKCESLRSMDSN